MISPKAEIDPKAKIGKNVTIYPFAYIEGDVVIGDDCVIYPYVSIMNGTRLGRGNTVYQNTVLGAVPQDFNYCGDASTLVIGDDNTFRENVVINRATFCSGETTIGNRNSFMEGVHVSHDTKISDDCVFGYGTKIAGDCEIENAVIFSSNVIANAGVRVGRGSMVQGGCRLSRDVPVQDHIANAYRLVFHGQTSVFDAVRQVREQVPDGPEIRHIEEFIDATKLGLISKMW